MRHAEHVFHVFGKTHFNFGVAVLHIYQRYAEFFTEWLFFNLPEYRISDYFVHDHLRQKVQMFLTLYMIAVADVKKKRASFSEARSVL
jgi:hypothetical protein